MSAANGTAVSEPSTTLMNTARLSGYLGLSVPTLERLRGTGEGPPYMKLGSGRTSRVMYDKRDVDAWLASKRRNSTGDGDADA
ncbi:helix-turn-helix domain-containing protein [Hyphomicrobium sp.]|jgi:predicted DNA-binding transcriptional regulator AlpA|uniref:helix-turn-helix transcriptional regulator n=1 Tax=Hyphomicrobium sp. TaxID=82 RepID=UPI0025C5F99A|nr:helix-turn-helix domain-containing protein [Hyphomicrobium sp.]